MKSLSNIWKNKYPSRKELRATVLCSIEPRSTKKATTRALKILDSEYEKADLNRIVDKADNLDSDQKQMLLKLLKQFENLFDGTLGKWNTNPVIIEMKPDAKTINSRWYTVPRINKLTFKNVLKRLEKIGVIERVQESE